MPAARDAAFRASSARSQTSSAPTRSGGRSANLILTSSKPKSAIDIEDQTGHRHALGGDLLLGHEDMRIVLGEGAHAHQAVQRARGLIAVHLAELGEAQRQLPVTAQTLLEDLHVARAVHGLDRVHALIGRRGEIHALAELLEVPGLAPQARIHELRRAHLLVSGRVCCSRM